MPEILKINNKNVNIKTEEKESYLSVLRKYNYSFPAYCNGKGVCGKCKIKFIKPENPPINSIESEILSPAELQSGYRLACQQTIFDQSKIYLDLEKDIKTVVRGKSFDIKINSEYNKLLIKADNLNEKNKKGAINKLLQITGQTDIDVDIIREISNLKKYDELTTFTTRENKIIDIEMGNKKDNLYGLAIDAGTTTLVLYLVNLQSGKIIDIISLSNSQRKYGSDIISRIDFSKNTNNGIKILKDLLINNTNNAIEEICIENNIKERNIYCTAISGNPFILHSLLAVKANTLAEAPYSPIFLCDLKFNKDKLSLNINKKGKVKFLPGLAGNVGADILAGLLTIDDSNYPYLFIDIGTNGEIVVNTGKNIYCCAAAAGPALEGGGLENGIPGIPGAIVDFNFEENQIRTIENKSPVGICGSGIINIIAELLQYKIIDKSGKFNSNNKNVIDYNGQKAFEITEEEKIVITQKDIRNIQLAIGALKAGINILMNKANISFTDIKTIYLAGGFGSALSPKNICKIGFLPDKVQNMIHRLGNSAGIGTISYMLNKKLKFKAINLQNRATYIDLYKYEKFQKLYVEAMKFNYFKT